MNSNVNTKEYYIAYFDVLGYKSFFENTNKEEILKFLKSIIQLAKDTIHKSSNLNMNYQGQIHVKSFSDNFMILLDSSVSETQAVDVLSKLMALLQVRFLEKYSILIRGCITKGDAYINESIVFGEGLINAVLLEQQAFFPRILIDKKRISIDSFVNGYDSLITKDEDDEYYINFLSYTNKIETYGYMKVTKDSNDPITQIQSNIIRLVNKYGKFNRQVKDIKKINEAERTISKYAWLLTKFNLYCDATDKQSYKIPYKLVLYYRLMKCEIAVDKDTK